MNKIIIIIGILVLISCKDNPKVISSESNEHTADGEYNTNVFGGGSDQPEQERMVAPVDSDVHTVVVNEILPTDKYVYLHVAEDDKEFWIATRKQDVVKGGTYHYKGGLLKRNFESKEYDRIFEEVYLVGNIVPSGHGMGEGQVTPSTDSKETKVTAPTKRNEDAMDIAEIVKNATKYEGKQILVSGMCVKLNANIMGKNWIHLQDGTMDDYDFVVTSDIAVPEGHSVSLKGMLTLNKDFGAGYRYDIILENAIVVP